MNRPNTTLARLALLLSLAPVIASRAAAPDAPAAAPEGPAACRPGVTAPAYAALGAAPAVRYLQDTPLSALPLQPACLGATMPQSGTFVEVAATFPMARGRSELLSRFGGVSDLLHVRYWSTSDHRWRPLISAATALTPSGQPRADFSAAEVDSGRDLDFSQTDSRSSHAATYRMHSRRGDAHRVVLEIENVSPLRWWGLTLYEPGELRSLYVMEQLAPGVWTYYSLTTVGDGRWPVSGHVNSYINRVIALYRHYTGLQTDSEPPPAP
jgi:hypothetical protein